MDEILTQLNQFSGLAFTLAGALALAVLAYAVGSAFIRALTHRRMSQGFADFARDAESAEVQIGSAAYKIRTTYAAYGLDITGQEELYFYSTVALIGLVAMGAFLLIQLNLILALIAGGAIGYFAVQALIAGRWEKTRLEIDAEIPTFLRNLSGIIQTEPNVLQAMASANESLDPGKPLHAWISFAIRTLQARGKEAFRTLRPEASEITSALGIAVFEIERLWEAGGEGYTRAFQMTADNLAEILTVKAQAASKASGATGLARLIIAAAVLTIGYILSSQVGEDIYLHNPLVKIVLALAVGWGIYGWMYIKEMVREATE
jgi:hypothetical protein